MKTWSVMVAVAAMALGANAFAEEKKAGAPQLKKAAETKAPEKAAAPEMKAAEPAKTAEPATAPAASSSSGISVEAKLCKNLQNREPVDVTDTFKVSDGQVLLWNRITGAAGSEIHHVYFLGDKQVDDVTLKINGSPWRTNSKKTLRPGLGMEGDWRVEVRDANGAVLETLKFKVE